MIFIKNNITGVISLIMFIISFFGSLSLFSYSNYYNLPFYKFIQPQIITAIGVLHIVVIAISIFMFCIVIFAITTTYKYFFKINKEEIKNIIEKKILFFIITSISLLSLLTMMYIEFSWYLVFTFAILPIPLYILMSRGFSSDNLLAIKITIFFFIFPVFFYFICMFFSHLNKIDVTTPLGIILSMGYILSITYCYDNEIDRGAIYNNVKLLFF